MHTIFATTVDIELELWLMEVVKLFACKKFVGTSTANYKGHCASPSCLGDNREDPTVMI